MLYITIKNAFLNNDPVTGSRTAYTFKIRIITVGCTVSQVDLPFLSISPVLPKELG